MFTMGEKIKDENSSFYMDELCANDYYSEGEKVTGKWYGSLAKEWDILSRPVSGGDFHAVMRHRSPWHRYDALTPGISPDGVSFFPFQCGAQKSVSVMAVVGGDARLVAAHEESVRAALTELERFAAVRVRTGEDHETEKTALTGKMLAALYTHDASRALDPQLHTHCVIANVTTLPDGRRAALTESRMMTAVQYAGRFYQSMMARKCRELGYTVRTVSGSKGVEGFEIEGVTEEMMKKFSRRREEIEKAIEEFRTEKGRAPSTAEINVIALRTRESKLKEISTAEVRALQRAMLTKEELASLAAAKRRAFARTSPVRELLPSRKMLIINAAAEAVFERRSVAARHEIHAEALKRGMGRISVKDTDGYIDAFLSRLSGGENTLCELYTTPKCQAMEKNAVAAVNSGAGKFSPFGSPVRTPGVRLSPDQRAAVEGVLASRDFAVIVRGAAGAGKTTALRALDAGLAASGRDVIYLAPTRGAVNVLKEDGFTKAETVARFLRAAPAIGKKTVLVIDEGSLLSDQSGIRVLARAAKAGCRVIINGDTRQHTSVDAGDFMRLLETSSEIEQFALTDIKRQIPVAYAAAIRAMADGRTSEGLATLEAMGAVKEAGPDYLDVAAKRYAENLCSGKKTMLVSPTHAEIDGLTPIVRTSLLARGWLPPDAPAKRETYCDYGYTKSDLANPELYKRGSAVRFNLAKGAIRIVDRCDAQKGVVFFTDGEKRSLSDLRQSSSLGDIRTIEIATGEKILITQNDKASGLVNGDVAEVVSVNRDGSVRLKDGRLIPAAFKSFSYGYATTSHKSQGATTSEVIVAAASLSDKACYVGSSRGRQSCFIVCPEYAALMRSVKKISDRMTVPEAEKIGLKA